MADVLLPSLLCATGIGFAFVPVTIAATAGVERREAGLASGLVNTSRQMGGSVGLALLAAIATQVSADSGAGRAQALTDGFTRAFEVGSGIAFTGARAQRAAAHPRPCGAEKSSSGPIGMIRDGSSESCVV